jgi:hypothetical protein
VTPEAVDGPIPIAAVWAGPVSGDGPPPAVVFTIAANPGRTIVHR